jgi:hypothetical protein
MIIVVRSLGFEPTPYGDITRTSLFFKHQQNIFYPSKTIVLLPQMFIFNLTRKFVNRLLFLSVVWFIFKTRIIREIKTSAIIEPAMVLSMEL